MCQISWSLEQQQQSYDGGNHTLLLPWLTVQKKPVSNKGSFVPNMFYVADRFSYKKSMTKLIGHGLISEPQQLKVTWDLA